MQLVHLVNLNRKECAALNENNFGKYSSHSGYYNLPVKEPWTCNQTLYSVITIGSSVMIGLAAACLFAPWLFGNTALSATGTTLIGIYYSIFALFAPIVLFCSCIHGCLKYNRKLFSERTSNRFNVQNIVYAIQAVCITFLKASLFYYLIAIFSSPLVLIIVVLVAVNSVFKIFRW